MPASEGQENDLSPKIYLLPSSATITIYIATEEARLPTGGGILSTCKQYSIAQSLLWSHIHRFDMTEKNVNRSVKY